MTVATSSTEQDTNLLMAQFLKDNASEEKPHNERRAKKLFGISIFSAAAASAIFVLCPPVGAVATFAWAFAGMGGAVIPLVKLVERGTDSRVTDIIEKNADNPALPQLLAQKEKKYQKIANACRKLDGVPMWGLLAMALGAALLFPPAAAVIFNTAFAFVLAKSAIGEYARSCALSAGEALQKAEQDTRQAQFCASGGCNICTSLEGLDAASDFGAAVNPKAQISIASPKSGQDLKR